MTALIVTKDACFARMLYLSLSDRNADAVVAESMPCAPGEPVKVAFVDAAEYVRSPVLDGCDTVIFGYDTDIDALGDEVRDPGAVYRRPFNIEDVLDRFIGKPAPFCDNTKKHRNSADDLHLSEASHSAIYHSEHISLTKREYELLKLLIGKRGSVVSRAEATRAVFGDGCAEGTNIVDVYVKYLRKKIDEKFGIKLIVSVRGAGYTIKGD